MKKIVIRRIIDSFTQLERAIYSAKATLEKQENPCQELVARVDNYEEMLNKQRNLATVMSAHAEVEDWEEVSRHIRLINGLSEMIRDDAREIVAASQTAKTILQDEMMLS